MRRAPKSPKDLSPLAKLIWERFFQDHSGSFKYCSDLVTEALLSHAAISIMQARHVPGLAPAEFTGRYIEAIWEIRPHLWF